MLKQYNDLLLDLYQAPHKENGWQDFTEQLVAFTQSRSAVINIQNSLTAEVVAIGHTGFDESDLANWQNYYINIDPWVAGLEKSETNTFYRGDELVERRVFNKTECANEFTLPLGIYKAVGAAIERPANNIKIVIAIQQDKLIGDLSEETFQYLQLMTPHIETAAALASETLPLLDHSKSLLEQLAQPSFICDANGAVEEMNTAATVLLSQYSSVAIRGKKLSLSNNRLDHRLKKMIMDASNLANTGTGNFLRLRNAHSDFLLKITPWLENSRDPFAPNRTLVMLKSTEGIYPINVREVAAFFGLSERESQVAQSIALGQNAKELAQEYKLKESTIRSHIKSILNKTRCKNQVHLVAVLNASRLHQR